MTQGTRTKQIAGGVAILLASASMVYGIRRTRGASTRSTVTS